MRSVLRLVSFLVGLIVVFGPAGSAQAQDPEIPLPFPPAPALPMPSIPVPGMSDCKQAPTPESPGQGIAGFFGGAPAELPPADDPFAKGASTTIYEQYGYAGLRWRTYDLGCGPDAMRNPDAVIGTAVSNWIMQGPIALTALTGSLTEAAFQPTFLGAFNPVIERVSDALHRNLFATWIPAVLAVLGVLIIFKARRSALSTTAAAMGWALIVVILATALFRWPVAAGNAADRVVTETLGSVVGQLDGDDTGTDPGTAVASHVTEAILYRAWLAGTFGSPDSDVAQKYGADLFKAQALTWREAAEADESTDRAREINDQKTEQWVEITAEIAEEDPEAYEHIMGKRSETRVGYAIVSGIGIFLALPFLVLSALLMLGCFLIVRLAVMIFPAFAVLGIFPGTRGLVTGLGRIVAAAVVNAIVFGIGAGVTIAVLGILFHPGGGAPAWLSLVLMPLFSVIMWVALKPFRRLTSMVSPDEVRFYGGSGPRRSGKRWVRQLAGTAVAAASGGAAGAAGAAAVNATEDEEDPPMRAEAKPGPPAPARQPAPLMPAPARRRDQGAAAQPPPSPVDPTRRGEERPAHDGTRHTQRAVPEPGFDERALPVGSVPSPTSEEWPDPPTEPEWYDGEEVYPIYRPSPDDTDDVA